MSGKSPWIISVREDILRHCIGLISEFVGADPGLKGGSNLQKGVRFVIFR